MLVPGNFEIWLFKKKSAKAFLNICVLTFVRGRQKRFWEGFLSAYFSLICAPYFTFFPNCMHHLTLQSFYIHESASQRGWTSDVIFSWVRGLIALWSRSAVAQSKAASNHTKKVLGCHLKFLSYRCSKGGHSVNSNTSTLLSWRWL